jgi:hypothetical protein
MQTLQLILCRGAVDRVFLGDLLERPGEALREYDLSPEEYAVIAQSSACSLVELAQAVEGYRRGDLVAAPVREQALVG